MKIEEDLLNWVLSDCRGEEDEEITEEMRKDIRNKIAQQGL